jgi:hypothetical protein
MVAAARAGRPVGSGRRLWPFAAGGAVALVVLAGAFLALGSTLSACLCIPMFGDPTNSCKATSGGAMSPAEETENRKKWQAGAQMASERCDARYKGLLAGTVFVADGERSPRAKELLRKECGPFTEAEKKYFHDGVVHLPLRETNPQLCDRLATATPPEAFTLKEEGGVVSFYYFTYDAAGDRLRVRDVYSKIAMDPSSLRFGSPPAIGGACFLHPAASARDEGAALLYASAGYNCWGMLTLASEDPDTAQIALCYGAATFKRTTQKLEGFGDGG